MNAPKARITPPFLTGVAFEGGFYAGEFKIGEQAFALIVAPKFDGELDNTAWIGNYNDIPGAKSYNDGLTNTNAMAGAGSALAQWSRKLRIGGFDDWYLPSQDELELCYRNLKPTAQENYCGARSGINLSAVPPTRPYTPDFPVQTSTDAFREGSSEAFDADWYWTSTQHAAYPDYAWYQTFDDGGQDDGRERHQLRARAVRRIAI